MLAGTLAFFAIGSFTCVIIDRLPLALDEPNRFGELWDTRPWREVLGGHSRCSSCGEPVRPYDNVPVVSWVILRGRCRGCGELIPSFHPVVEVLSPLLFLAAVSAIGIQWRLLPALLMIPVGLAISVIDFRTLIVPTRLVWPALVGSVILTVVAIALDGDWKSLRSALIGLAVMAGPLFVIWFIHPRGMGFGDVRLATLIGFNVGFYAGTATMAPVVLGVLAMALSALLGILIGVIALGARGRKAQVPFGPSLLAGGYFCMLLAPKILSPFGF